MLQDLPEFAYQHLLEQHLSDLEVKTLRLVSKECKSMVDTSLTTLRPKDIANLKVIDASHHTRTLYSSLLLRLLLISRYSK